MRGERLTGLAFMAALSAAVSTSAALPRHAHLMTAGDSTRLVVLESFMRDICPNCAGVGEKLRQIAPDYSADRLLIIEHDNDNRKGERYARWDQSGGDGSSLPLTMIDSGHWAAGGPAESADDFRAMIDAALLRAPLAELGGHTVRSGDSLTVTVEVRNLSGVALDPGTNAAALHAILYEPGRVHVLDNFARAVTSRPLPGALQADETGSYELPLGELPGLDWDTAQLIVLLDYRPGGTAGAYDLLQAGRIEIPQEQRHAPVTERLESGDWTIDLVDRHGIVGSYASLALDADGRPHIVYRHTNLWALRHAWRDSHGWLVETVADDVDAGQYADLAVGEDGRLFVSYYDRTNGDLRVVVKQGGRWHTETVDSSGDVGWYTDIALDSHGNPRVCYVDAGTGVLRYAAYDGNAWRTETVDSSVNEGANWSLAALLASLTSMAVDGSDRAHIAYYDDQGANLHYAVQSDSGWRLEVADAGAYAGVDPSIALDEAGSPRIAYNDYINDRLKLATRLTYSWRPIVVDDEGLVGMGASMALDGDGRAHIAYREYGHALGAIELRYAREQDSGWEITVIDPGPKAGRYPSIALDAADEPHVAYYDDDFQNLRYAERGTPVAAATATPSPSATATATATATSTRAVPTVATDLCAHLPVAYRHAPGEGAR